MGRKGQSGNEGVPEQRLPVRGVLDRQEFPRYRTSAALSYWLKATWGMYSSLKVGKVS